MSSIDSVIVFTNPENPTRVCIMSPTGFVPIEDLILQNIDTTKPYKVMNRSDLPIADVDYCDAWQLVPFIEDPNTYEIQVHMENARNIHRNMLREERKPKLEALDIAFMLALERGDTIQQKEIAIQKQKLRDITIHPSITAATNAAELRILTLDLLLTTSISNN